MDTQKQQLIKVENFKICKMGPTNMKELIGENLGSGALSAQDLDRVKTPTGGHLKWSIPSISAKDGFEDAEEFAGIIIHWNDSRSFWMKDYDEAPDEPPDCYSGDALIGEGNPGGDCLICPNAEWDTGKKGIGQACKLMRKLFILRPNQVLPTMIAVGPGSYKNVKSYFTKLITEGLPYWQVITALTLSKAENSKGLKFSKINARMLGVIPDEQLGAIKGYRGLVRNSLMNIKTSQKDFDKEKNG